MKEIKKGKRRNRRYGTKERKEEGSYERYKKKRKMKEGMLGKRRKGR